MSATEGWICPRCGTVYAPWMATCTAPKCGTTGATTTNVLYRCALCGNTYYGNHACSTVSS